jgi:predicted acyltransferase
MKSTVTAEQTSLLKVTITGETSSQRLYSLDALRGFDMFWIMGAEEIFHAMNEATGKSSSFWSALSNQLTHPAWNGFHFYDLIFPLFLFMAGAATPFSVGRELEKGKTQKECLMRVIKRGLTLVLLGLVVNNGLQLPLMLPRLCIVGVIALFRLSLKMVKATLPAVALGIVLSAALVWITSLIISAWGQPVSLAEIRFGSVLGRIGLAYMFANIIYIYTKKQSTQIIWFCSFIIGYWLLLKFTSAPGFAAGTLTQEGNFASYIDRVVLPGKLYLGNHDPEGLMSTIPAISTGLLGILAGSYLKNSADSGSKKAGRLALAGIIFIGIALLWNFDFPINKNLWTSSFVMNVGGISLLLLSLFYFVIDVKGYKKWAFFFKVIGMNSILIYMSGHFINWEYTTNGFFHWLGQLISEPYNAVALAICYVGVKWAFLYFMYEKKVFLRV